MILEETTKEAEMELCFSEEEDGMREGEEDSKIWGNNPSITKKKEETRGMELNSVNHIQGNSQIYSPYSVMNMHPMYISPPPPSDVSDTDHLYWENTKPHKSAEYNQYIGLTPQYEYISNIHARNNPDILCGGEQSILFGNKYFPAQGFPPLMRPSSSRITTYEHGHELSNESRNEEKVKEEDKQNKQGKQEEKEDKEESRQGLRYFESEKCIRCYKCRSYGHLASTCNAKDMCIICGYPGHPIVANCPLKRCFKCGEIGHEVRECGKLESQIIKCYKCGIFGHSGGECRNLTGRAQELKGVTGGALMEMKCMDCGELGHGGICLERDVRGGELNSGKSINELLLMDEEVEGYNEGEGELEEGELREVLPASRQGGELKQKHKYEEKHAEKDMKYRGVRCSICLGEHWDGDTEEHPRNPQGVVKILIDRLPKSAPIRGERDHSWGIYNTSNNGDKVYRGHPRSHYPSLPHITHIPHIPHMHHTQSSPPNPPNPHNLTTHNNHNQFSCSNQDADNTYYEQITHNSYPYNTNNWANPPPLTKSISSYTTHHHTHTTT